MAENESEFDTLLKALEESYKADLHKLDFCV